MRVLIRKNIDLAGATTIFDTTYSYSDSAKIRSHYTAINPVINEILRSEMEAIHDNPAHNYLDVLISRRTV